MPNCIKFAFALLLVAAPVLAQSQEALHPTLGFEPIPDPFVEGPIVDPLVKPTAISGPLDGERLERDWDLDQRKWLDPDAFPDEVFSDSPEPCVPKSAVPAIPRRKIPIYDSGLTFTWLAPVDGFGVTDFDKKLSLVFPVFYQGSPLRLALGAGTSIFNSPAGITLPNEVYNFTAELRWLIPLRPTWGVDLGLGAGSFSDLQGTFGQGFRVTGRMIFIKDLSPTWKLSFGALYLGRKNLPAMPLAGAIWTPSDDFKIEILIPRPRLMRRVAMFGDKELWGYFGAEIFGGNTWAVSMPDGTQDTFIYKDNRLIAGYEIKAPSGLAGRVEMGYVMSRHVSFSNSPTTLDPGGTLMLRTGFTY